MTNKELVIKCDITYFCIGNIANNWMDAQHVKVVKSDRKAEVIVTNLKIFTFTTISLIIGARLIPFQPLSIPDLPGICPNSILPQRSP